MKKIRIQNLIVYLYLSASLLLVKEAFSTDTPQPLTIQDDQLVTDLTIDSKSQRHFLMSVSEENFKATGHLAISVHPTSFDSDPDLFIAKESRSEFPKNASTADWYSERLGSDTIIIPQGTFEIGDTMWIAVRCVRFCSFDLRTSYVREIDLVEGRRATYRWGGHQTHILKYTVPESTAEEPINSFSVMLQPEGDYQHLQVFISYDQHFNVIEDRPAPHIMKDGVAVTMSDTDARWCVNCILYLIVNTFEDRRLYVTASSSNNKNYIAQNLETQVFVNQGEFMCKLYSVDRSRNDVFFTVEGFQGIADIAIARRNEPSSLNGNTVRLISRNSDPKQTLIVQEQDREEWSSEIGTHYLCFQAYDTYSARVKIVESANEHIFDSTGEWQQIFFLRRAAAVQFKYAQDEFRSQKATLKVEAKVFTENGADLADVNIFYKLCTSSDESQNWCNLTPEEAAGSGQVEPLDGIKVAQSLGGNVIDNTHESFVYSGEIQHNPSACQGTSACTYVISVFNSSLRDVKRQAQLKVSIETSEQTDIQPLQLYKNIISNGDMQYYRILDSQFEMEFLKKLQINLKTLRGDADLFVSTSTAITHPNPSQYEYQSQRLGKFDQITLVDSVNTPLGDYVYIGVFGRTFAEYELSFVVDNHPNLNEKLVYASPLRDRIPIQHTFYDEFGALFLSFRPEWGATDNRAVVFLADSETNDVTFYAAVDDYPLVYTSDLVATNEMLIVNPQEAAEKHSPGNFGTYYIRLRPGYVLSDLVVDDPYKFTFHAFSQPINDDQFTDLFADDQLIGAAWMNQSALYRHFVTDREQTVVIGLKRLKRKGLPTLMAEMRKDKIRPVSDQPATYDSKVSMSQDQDYIEIVLHKDMRSRSDPDCDFAGYALERGGNEQCAIYIAVECASNEQMCAFEISLTLHERTLSVLETGFPVLQIPPKYIPKDVNFIDGYLAPGEEAFFYYPVGRQPIDADYLLMVNKTGPFGTNGHVTLSMNVLTNVTQPYGEWDLATRNRNTIFSDTQDPVQPEIITVCRSVLGKACNLTDTPCAMSITVSNSDVKGANFRIKVLDSSNKINSAIPAQGSLSRQGDYANFWFYSSAPQKLGKIIDFWQHNIGLGVHTIGADFDLYVSVMDVRYPSLNDYDFKSENLGSDYVTLTSDMPIFQHLTEESWDPKNAGLVVMIGIRLVSSEPASFSVSVDGPAHPSYSISTLETNLPLVTYIDPDEKRSEKKSDFRVFRWYNWEHGDFSIQVKGISGVSSFYLNSIGETSFQENAYTGVPTAVENSEWHTALNGSDNGNSTAEVVIFRSDTDRRPMFCYACWYYLTVRVSDPTATSYRVFVKRVEDQTENFFLMSLGSSYDFNFSRLGETKYARIMFNSKDPFTVQAIVSQGEVKVAIQKDPTDIMTTPIWQMDQGVGTGLLKVQMDDPNFELSTYYFIGIESTRDVSSINLQVSQVRQIERISNKQPIKLQFISERELVKHLVFQLPQTWSFHTNTTISLEALSENIYPEMYISRVNFADVPADFESLEFPTIANYEFNFGDNITEVVQFDKMEYKLNTQSQLAFSYLLITVYQQTHGLTDLRKPEFKLTIESVEVAAPPVVLQQANLNMEEMGNKISPSEEILV